MNFQEAINAYLEFKEKIFHHAKRTGTSDDIDVVAYKHDLFKKAHYLLGILRLEAEQIERDIKMYEEIL